MIRKFQCGKCGKTVESTPESYCAPSPLLRERTPTCPDCGLDMLEVID